jgi:hypothetical protein
MIASALRHAAFAIAATLALPAMAQTQPDRAAQEIAWLLDTVGHSQCQFNRNGSWYDAAKAREHLQEKYDYLKDRKLAPTAEAFIERAATSSSMSGKAYQLRCPGAAPVDSASWLKEQLARYRKQGH